ncbi:MAG TPA: hemolysin family protein [Terriglobia bacterium]|jgi:CBS domain containing-hemolysin-like protein
MLSGTEIFIGIAFVFALLVMSIIDIAFTNVNKVSVRRLVDHPYGKAAPALAEMLEARAEVITSIHVVIQLLLVLGSVLVFTAFQMRAIPFTGTVIGTLVVMMLVIAIFRHLLPRIITMRSPEAVLLRLFTIFRIVHFAMRPVSMPLTAALNYFQRWEEEIEPVKEEETSEEEIQAFIDAGQEEGILEHDEGEMIQSIVHFGDKVAREVMTPRTQIVAVDINSTVDKLLQLIVAKRHARIPVYRDDLDNIEGILHERDLLRIWQRGDKLDNLRPLTNPANFIPETKPVDDLLQEMKEKGDQMVLVVDEYGGISGLITMEDLVEEIVGEIHDDSDGSAEKIVEERKGVIVVSGSLELEALEEKLGVPLVANTDCTTVAGAVVELFGRLPSPGEKIEHGGVEIEVLDADRRRVQRLRLKTLAPKTHE